MNCSARSLHRLSNVLLGVLLVFSVARSSAAEPESNPNAKRDAAPFDLVIAGGTVFDGTGAQPRVTDVGIRGDRVAAIGDLAAAPAKQRVDAKGQAVAPGFINMLSWASDSLLVDGRSQSDIRQGVTLEVFGEGWSMGPLNARMKQELRDRQGDIKFDVAWTTLGEYLEHLERRGVSCNVASFVGATTVRIHAIGYDDRPPTTSELNQMRGLVRAAMEEGAVGVGSSLIYAPAFYAQTDELIELCKVAAEHQGMYISHIRSEGNRLVESIEELIRIAREAGLPAEIYHLKAAGEKNWPKRQRVIELVVEDHSRVDTVYFMMSEDDVRRNVALPWVSFGSDAASEAPEGPFLLSQPHPRAYGNFARVLGKYVREENVIPLAEAIRKLSGLPAENLGIRERGLLREGYFADVVVFDPAKVTDHATFERPQQYATGMRHVFVNGTHVLAEGEHTGATPGRAVWGRGRKQG